MFGRLCRRSRIMYLLVIMTLFYVIFKCINYFLTNDSNNELGVCQMSKQAMNDLLNLAEKVDSVLETFNITHFLCYGTLWGALRQSKIFPWKTNFDFCVLNEDIVRLDEVFFRRQFSKQALKIDYDSANGFYLLTAASNGARDGVTKGQEPSIGVNMYVFEELPELKIYRRIGFKNRLLPPTSDNIGSFPSRLAKTPLTAIKLNGRSFPAPREGLEIQKYHYKDNWWTEVKPPSCFNRKKVD